MKILVLVLALFLANCDARRCCVNEAKISSNGSCNDGESIAKKINCPHGAYVADQEDDKFFIDDEDRLNFTEFAEDMINADEYCIGEMESNNRTVAVICFGQEASGLETQWQFAVRIVCCSVSIVCLGLTLLVYLVLPKLRDLQGRCLMLSIFSLMVSFLFLSTVQLSTQYTLSTCIGLAFFIYFWFTCAFTWLNIVSINLMLSVMNPKWFTEFKHTFLVYNAYGWGLPLVLLVTIISHHMPGEHLRPRFGESRCWFHGEKEAWVFFYGPISVLLVSNLVMFIVTIWVLVKNEKLFAATKLRSHKFKCMLYMKLFFIVGVLWLFEPLSAIPAISDWKLWIVTDTLNSLQGILIFLLLVVFRNRVRRDLAKKGITCCHFMDSWTAIKEEDCEELDEEKNDVTVTNINSLT